MIGEDFYFRGHYLSDFNLMMASPDKEEVSGLNREVLKGTTTIYKYEAAHFGAKYSDVLTVPFFIVKNECEDNNLRFSQNELRAVSRWLTDSHLPEQLTVSFENSNPIEYFGIFTEITPFIVDGLNGLYLTFTCTSPFAFEENYQKFTVTEQNEDISFECTSDENTYIYPVVIIEPAVSGVYSIYNQSDGKTMQFTLNSPYRTFAIDCKLKRIIADGQVLSPSDIGWNMEDIVDYNNVGTGTVELYWLRFKPLINYVVIN